MSNTLIIAFALTIGVFLNTLNFIQSKFSKLFGTDSKNGSANALTNVQVNNSAKPPNTPPTPVVTPPTPVNSTPNQKSTTQGGRQTRSRHTKHAQRNSKKTRRSRK